MTRLAAMNIALRTNNLRVDNQSIRSWVNNSIITHALSGMYEVTLYRIPNEERKRLATELLKDDFTVGYKKNKDGTSDLTIEWYPLFAKS